MDAAMNAKLAAFAVDRIDEPVLWMDSAARLLYANAAARRSLASSADELLSRTLFDISPDLTPDMWRGLWKQISAQGHFECEFSLRALDGRIFAVDMSVHLFQSGADERACVFFRDIEEHKRLQQLKEEFVSTVSHELRTPMTIIREGVSQVIEGLRGDVTPDQHRALSIALTGIDRLGRIINELLDVSKIDAGKMTLRRERIDFTSLVREVCGTFALRARERHLEIRTHLPEKPVESFVDRDRIIQVLTNLLGNAFKFTETGYVQVSLAVVNGDVQCTVEDTGMGIPREDLAKVFNKFEQLGRVSVTGEKGTGLGLSICQGIIELHHGRIWAESAQGKGARFLFTLPQETARDVFRRDLTDRLTEAAADGASLSAVWFKIQPIDGAPPAAVESAIELLENLVHKHSGRKTDMITRDTQTIFLGMPATVSKEAARVAEKVRGSFADCVTREGLDHQVRLSSRVTSFPEGAPSQEDFLRQHFAEL